jgi:hypothetical protein
MRPAELPAIMQSGRRKELMQVVRGWTFVCGYLALLMSLDSRKYNDLGCGLADPGFNSWQKQVIFLISEMSTPHLGPTQPHIQWIVELCHPVLTIRMSAAMHSLPPYAFMPYLRKSLPLLVNTIY